MVWYIIDGVNIFVKMFINSQEHVQEEKMDTSEDGQAKQDEDKDKDKAKQDEDKEEIKDEDEETPGKGVSEEENIKIPQ